MKKLPQTPRLTCWQCFLGNRGVWSWSHCGSLWMASRLLWQSHPHSVKQDNKGHTLCSLQSEAVPANHPFCGNKKSFSLPPGSQATRRTHSITWANSGDMPRQARRTADREHLHFLGRKAEGGPEPPAESSSWAPALTFTACKTGTCKSSLLEALAPYFENWHSPWKLTFVP